MKFKYIGDHPKVETLGHVFPAGVMVEVGEGAVAKKLMGNTCFKAETIEKEVVVIIANNEELLADDEVFVEEPVAELVEDLEPITPRNKPGRPRAK